MTALPRHSICIGIAEDSAHGFLLIDANTNDPLDISSASFKAEVRAERGGSILFDLNVTVVDVPTAKISIGKTKAESDLLTPGTKGFADVRMTKAGLDEHLFELQVEVIERWTQD